MKALKGAFNFFMPFPGGNGRLRHLHNLQDGFSLSPATVEARWQRLQRMRRINPNADDPLFRSIDADDGNQDFAAPHSRAHQVRVPLPDRVRLTDDPTATHVTFSRAVPPLNMLKHTAPYQQDRTAKTLEEQALGPSMRTWSLQFSRRRSSSKQSPNSSGIFSLRQSQKAVEGHRRRRLGSDIDPPLTALERRGKERFDFFCAKCHGGPSQTQNLENRVSPPFDGSTNPVSLNVVVSNPPPTGFPLSPIQGPASTCRRSACCHAAQRHERGSSLKRPRHGATDINALATVGGNQVFNRFDVPQLQGINKTAPYFHDHRAKTLGDVVKHPAILLLHQRRARVSCRRFPMRTSLLSWLT